MDSALTLAIIQAILIYGPNAVVAISKVIQSGDDITPDTINELFIDKDPEDYFND